MLGSLFGLKMFDLLWDTRREVSELTDKIHHGPPYPTQINLVEFQRGPGESGTSMGYDDDLVNHW